MWGQVPTSQNTHCYCITKHELVNAVSDTLAVHYNNYTEQIDHTTRAECSVYNVTVGGPHSYHSPLTYLASTEAQFASLRTLTLPVNTHQTACFLHTQNTNTIKRNEREMWIFFLN